MARRRALTATVPLLALAAMRRERTVLYQTAAAVVALGATWAWLAAAGVTVVEAYTLPAALLALAAGIRAWQPGPGRSWLAFGVPIAICLGPTLAIAITQDDTARAIAATVLAIVVLILGARWRLQAPIALGAAALVALAVDTLGPTAAHLPRWVPLAIAGVVVMWVGATFERRREDLRRSTRVLLGLG